jgi:outer membrane receptor protein involved in Fe transport
MNSFRVSLVVATALASLAPLLAHARQADAGEPQAADQPSGGEIVVTARQRGERLIDVPVAVNAISQQDLQRYNSNSLGDIAQMAPQVKIAQQASGGGSSFVIRGIGSSTLDTGFDQSVAINVDGVQTSRGRSLQQSYFDVQQVEILKGPQALFFGKNSPAGVISMKTADPTPDFSAGLNLGYEFKAREWTGNGYVSGPITDTLGFRVAVRARTMRGWMENYPGTTIPGWEPATGLDMLPAERWGPKQKEVIGRLTLAFQPTPDFDMKFKFTAGVSRDNGEGTNGEIVYCGGGPVNGLIDPYEDCTPNRKVVSAYVPPELLNGYIGNRNGRPYEEYKPILSSLTANWKSDKIALTSVTGYYRYHLGYLQNGFEKSSYAYNLGSQVEKFRSFSQELRALTTFDGPLNAMIGLYFEDTKLYNGQTFRIAALPQDPATGYYQSISKTGTLNGRTYSAFGQITYQILPELELAGGVRWTKEKKGVAQRNTYVHPLLAAGFPLTEFTGDYDGDNFSPEATLTWHPTPQTTLYAAYKTGFKSGGFGLPAILSTGTVASDFTFGPEKVRGGEIGFKGEFLNGRLTLNSNIYMYDYKGLQVDIFDGTKVTYQVFNAGKARTKGFELGLRYKATDALSLRGGIGYNHARYRDYLSACYAGQTIAAGCSLQPDANGVFTRQDLSGAPLVRAPDWSGNIGATYDTPVSDGINLSISSDLTGTSKYYFSETEGPGTLQDGYVEIGAAIRLYQPDRGWSLALIGKNLTNRYVVAGGSDRPGTGAGAGTTIGTNADIIGYIERPREITLQVGYKF